MPLYPEYHELSYFVGIIDSKSGSFAWTTDGDVTLSKAFKQAYITANYETQPVLLSVGGWAGSVKVSFKIPAFVNRVHQLRFAH